MTARSIVPRTRVEVLRIPNEMTKLVVTGWVSQDRLERHQSGLPLSVYSKILANMIFEVNHANSIWNNTSLLRISRFLSFWTPHRFGAVFSLPDRILPPRCSTQTGRAYLQDLSKDTDLMSGLGMEMIPPPDRDGPNDVHPSEAREESGTGTSSRRTVRFAIAPSAHVDRWVREGTMSRGEYEDLIDLVAVFTSIYRKNSKALNTFATCRTNETTITAIDTEIVHFKHDIQTVMDLYWQPRRRPLMENLRQARACANEMREKAKLFRNLSRVVEETEPSLAPLRLGKHVLAHVGEPIVSSKLAAREELQPFFFHMANVVTACLSLCGCYGIRGNDARTTLSESINFLRDNWSIQANVNAFTAAADQNRIPKVKAELEGLLTSSWASLEQKIGTSIPSRVEWYDRQEDDPFLRLF